MRPLAFVCGLALCSSAGCARAYRANGLVLSTDPSTSTITVSHDAIPGFMDAMAMRFELRDRAQPQAPAPGDRVEFRLRAKDGRAWIDRLRVTSAAPFDAGLTRSPAVATLVPVGSEMRDFALTDHRGARVSLAELRGRVVAVNFIYTRCPLLEYCPRMVQQFKAVRARFDDRLGQDLGLLTITIDPRFDTVDTLGAYARANGADAPGWHFLTGTPEEIERVAEIFGVQFWPDEGLLTHTLQTAVIDRQGRLAATIEGKDFTGRQLGDLVEAVLQSRR